MALTYVTGTGPLYTPGGVAAPLKNRRVTIEAASADGVLRHVTDGVVFAGKFTGRTTETGQLTMVLPTLPQSGLEPTDAEWKLSFPEDLGIEPVYFTAAADFTWADVVNVASVPPTDALIDTLNTLLATFATFGVPKVVVQPADVVNNNASANTIASVTGLAFPVTAGKKYRFRFDIQYDAAATTTGSRWSITGPAGGTMRFRSEYSLTTTTRTLNDGLSAYDTPAASNATSAATGSNIAVIEGFIEPANSGTVTARFASEVSSSAITARAGSTVTFQEVL